MQILEDYWKWCDENSVEERVNKQKKHIDEDKAHVALQQALACGIIVGKVLSSCNFLKVVCLTSNLMEAAFFSILQMLPTVRKLKLSQPEGVDGRRLNGLIELQELELNCCGISDGRFRDLINSDKLISLKIECGSSLSNNAVVFMSEKLKLH